jgi:hypothetical protein
MNQFNYLNLKEKVSDNSKGQKIAAALYLVSGHLSDTDPLRVALRTHAVTLSTSENDAFKTSATHAIESLLNTAVIARLISEKNASIIQLELRHYVVHVSTEPDNISHLFSSGEQQVPLRTNTQIMKSSPSKMSYNNPHLSVNNPLKIPLINENKSKRQDAILSFINERKSVGIKDISALFSDTSEKTIQRELGTLVAAGKITKRGEKRWSVYLSV